MKIAGCQKWPKLYIIQFSTFADHHPEIIIVLVILNVQTYKVSSEFLWIFQTTEAQCRQALVNVVCCGLKGGVCMVSESFLPKTLP